MLNNTANPAWPSDVEVAIIGTGSAGMAAYRAASRHTTRIALIEAGPYGTTCARVGCMPSKLLIAAAEAAGAVRAAAQFGVRPGQLAIDGQAVMQRVRDERDRFAGLVEATVHSWPAEQQLRGHARFLSDHVLDINGHHLRAERIVIATGSQPSVPAAWRAELGDRLLINDDVFSWDTLPASVLVIGAGAIGLELAQALQGLGVQVQLLSRSERLGPLTDPLLLEHGRQLVGQSVPAMFGVDQIDLARDGMGVSVRAHSRFGQRLVGRFDWVLAATGRQPNLDGLGLESTSLPRDERGRLLYDRSTGQIGNSHVFIAGDANADSMLLHEAADEGQIAGDNAGRFPDVRPRPRRVPLSIVFSHPQIMVAGATWAELQQSDVGFACGRVDFADQGRSRVIGENRGALHLYAAHTSAILLGAEMIGPKAEHLAHLLAWSIQRGDSVQAMLDSPFYHPVVEEGLRTALRALQSQLERGRAGS
jgi:dihydrolipoamide dehydrogenase